MISTLVLIVYASALVFILLYSMMQISLVRSYLRFKTKEKKTAITEKSLSEYPFVTIQLPIYNEKYVIEQLIDAVAAFDYPKDKFEIQVLDDSTDDTVEIVAQKVAEIQKQGISIAQIQREDRVGFKAGALQYGTGIAKGEYIAIFDADFVPTPDFLQKTLPHFDDPSIGVVQTRWGHINEKYSLLTRLQAFALDAHFSIEQMGRNAGGHFINFNGTAGIWKRECINGAGGWQADTLTEDLDLSYRAQLKGWKFKYLEQHLSPAELPAAMSAIKSQQFRWNKGAAECARKNLSKVLKSKLSLSTKVHAAFHLLNTGVFISIFLCAILSVPVLYIKSASPELELFFHVASIFLLSLVVLIIFFWVSRGNDNLKPAKRFVNFVLTFPVFLAVSMGLSLHNALAVIEGYIGKKSPFIRTPKFKLKDIKDKWKGKQYLKSSINLLTMLEGALAFYFAGGMALAVQVGDFALMPYHFLLTLGFGLVFFYSVKHSLGFE